MSTIRFKSTDWFIIAIIITIIICAVIWQGKDLNTKAPNQDRIGALSRKLKELEEEMQKEIESLKLTQEMKHFLEKKISRWLLIAKAVFVLINIGVIGLFYSAGYDPMTSIFSGLGMITVILTGGSFLLVSRIDDPNTMIKSSQNLIRKWIHKKYGYDPSSEETILVSIKEKEDQRHELQNQIQQIDLKDNALNS